jgi:hypothetical protein
MAGHAVTAPTAFDLATLADDMRDLADQAAAAVNVVQSPVVGAWIAHTHWLAKQLEERKTP